ncbi:MAG: winged helix-turn-helix transcriptional regulator [Gammaproteobacteria bacterium]|nr:winged helix-turn-helix transcriptional regulator [Gammaproteobacteria bacterium]
MNAPEDREARLTLGLLSAIDGHSDVSQRHLARDMGVALGLANSYLKRCVRKGYVKMREAPANRFLYYLTPKGFAEKSRLTTRYLTNSLTFYRQAAESCSHAFAVCCEKGHRKVLLCGYSDLAEIALLRAMEFEIEIIGVFDRSVAHKHFYSRPVWASLKSVPNYDIALLTDLNSTVEHYYKLVDTLGEDRVMVPGVLDIIKPLPVHMVSE